MKKILVPTDLSSLAENALKLAVKLAAKNNGHIELVHFYKHPYGETFTATGELSKKVSNEENLFTLQLLKKNANDLQNIADRNVVEGVEIAHQIFDQDFDEGMEIFIKNNNVDLVVMGTTGEENATEFFTGNHAQQVIESATCPVITLREDDTIGNLGKIVLGVDFEKDSSDNVSKSIGYINDLADSIKAEIHLVHVINDSNENEAQLALEKFIKDYGLLNCKSVVVKHDDDESGLLKYSHEVDAGILAVLTHADGGFFRVFERNLSEHITKHADMPILTVNLHKV